MDLKNLFLAQILLLVCVQSVPILKEVERVCSET
jgi:hypothetical protein